MKTCVVKELVASAAVDPQPVPSVIEFGRISLSLPSTWEAQSMVVVHPVQLRHAGADAPAGLPRSIWVEVQLTRLPGDAGSAQSFLAGIDRQLRGRGVSFKRIGETRASSDGRPIVERQIDDGAGALTQIQTAVLHDDQVLCATGWARGPLTEHEREQLIGVLGTVSVTPS